MRNHPGPLRLWVRDPRRRIFPLPKALLLLAMLSIPRSKRLRPHHHWSLVTHIDLSKPHKPLVMSLYSGCVPLLALLTISPSAHELCLYMVCLDVPSLSLPRRLCISFPTSHYSCLISVAHPLLGVPLRGTAKYVMKMNDKCVSVLRCDFCDGLVKLDLGLCSPTITSPAANVSFLLLQVSVILLSHGP
jgi:hypothetical protein